MFGNGISGCRLSLVDERTVRKESPNEGYNERLVRQATKQRLFERTSIDGVRTPSVSAISEGKPAFFEMDFVAGQTPYELFVHCDVPTVERFATRLLNYLRHTSSYGRPDAEGFRSRTLRKLEDVMAKTEHVAFVEYLTSRASAASFNITKSFCHGDLTLSNIIYMKGDVYLIDFLDSFIDTPLIDLAKLKQDLIYDWTLDCHVDCTENQRTRIRQVCRRIWRTIEAEMHEHTRTEEFRITEALNFLRIEPYTKNEKMRQKLDETIKKLPIYEEFDSAYGRQVDKVP